MPNRKHGVKTMTAECRNGRKGAEGMKEWGETGTK